MKTEYLMLFDQMNASLNSAYEWGQGACKAQNDRELGYALAMVQANLDALEDWLAKLEDAFREEVEE